MLGPLQLLTGPLRNSMRSELYLLFHSVDICVHDIKAKVGKTASALA